MRVLSILRRRWLVVTVTTTLCLAAAAMAIMLLQPRWKATASVVLHMSGPQVLDKVKGVAEDAEGRVLGYREYYQTQRTIMQSRSVAERALAELGLAKDPVFLGIADVETEAERQVLAEQIDPVERLRELTHVQEVRNSRVVEISAEYPDPVVASEIANAVADAYIAHVQRSRSRVGEEAKDNISAERTKALEQVQSAEKALEDFKRNNEITSISLSDRQNVITQDILTLSAKAKDAEADRTKLENRLEQAKRLHQQGNLAAANLLPEGDRALFEKLRTEQLDAEAEFSAIDVEYGPKHDEHRKAKRRLDLINTKIDREANNLIDSLESELAAARATERDLSRSIDREHGRALRLGELERGYRGLEREAKAAAEDYLLVARRDTEIAITNRVEAEGIEILDRATVPTLPVFPPKLLLLALGLVAGLGLGALLAISIDFRDHRIRGLLDLERALANFGLPVLGQLPLLPTDNRLGLGNVRAQRRQRDPVDASIAQHLVDRRGQDRVRAHLDEHARVALEQPPDRRPEQYRPAQVLSPVLAVELTAGRQRAGDRRRDRHRGILGPHPGQHAAELVQERIDLRTVRRDIDLDPAAEHIAGGQLGDKLVQRDRVPRDHGRARPVRHRDRQPVPPPVEREDVGFAAVLAGAGLAAFGLYSGVLSL